MKRDEHLAGAERQITIVISAERAAELDGLRRNATSIQTISQANYWKPRFRLSMA